LDQFGKDCIWLDVDFPCGPCRIDQYDGDDEEGKASCFALHDPHKRLALFLYLTKFSAGNAVELVVGLLPFQTLEIRMTNEKVSMMLEHARQNGPDANIVSDLTDEFDRLTLTRDSSSSSAPGPE